MMANIGDLVEVLTVREKISGVMLPSKNDAKIVLKLASGYNLSIFRKEIKEIHVLESKKEAVPKKVQLKQDAKLKTVYILHTGGTIASKVDYATGAVSAKFSPLDLLELVPEISGLVNIKSKLVSNMFSEDINFSHYNLLALEIDKIKDECDGVIITHGTDTISYSSCALAFALEGISIPVILVGSQRSSDRPSSDAFLNLYMACKFIAESDFFGVCMCMHETLDDEKCLIYNPCSTKKMHSSRRDAFKSINSNPIARVSHKGVEFISRPHSKKGELKLRLFDEKLRIGVLVSHPNLNAQEVKNYGSFDGLVLVGTGIGHFPINKIDENTVQNEEILSEIRKLCKKMPVVMTTQSVFGRVNLNVYSTRRKLLEAGVLGDQLDILYESALIKLAWLLSNHKDNIRELYHKNFHGEISERSEE